MFEIIKENKKPIIIIGSASIVSISLLFLKESKSKINDKIVNTALKYVGQTEIYQDKGFHNADFEQKMKSVGWFGEKMENGEVVRKGLPWCAFFVKLVFMEAFEGEKRQILNKIMSGSSQGTFINFKKHENRYSWFSTSKVPKRGSIAVWQSQKNKAQGHLGIVESVTKNGFIAIEGNSGANPPKVQRVQRSFTEFNKKTGNKLIGFVNFK